MKNSQIGAENVRWDLSFLYSGINDPRIDADLKKFTRLAKKFHIDYNGKLSSKLGNAISDFSEIMMLSNKIELFIFCNWTVDLNNPKIKTKKAEIEKTFAKTNGEYLQFFTLQIIELSNKELQKLYKNPIVLKHKPWIEQIRIFKPHVLSEPVESALTKRSPFGPGAWDDFFDETEADLVFKYKGEKTLTEMLNILTNSKNTKERFTVMKKINEGLKGFFLKYSAQNLYMVYGSKAVESEERKYKHPMEQRNKTNRVSDDVVNALHKATLEIAGPLTKKYYKLKAVHLGLKTLRWSDRNAPMPFSDSSIIPFEEATKIVIDAYKSFSPTLAEIINKIVKEKRIDAPAIKNKQSGAYNYSVVLPKNTPTSLNLLNYLGSNRDVMTFAHELGHAVHGILAGEAQGVLMQHAPIIYAETASVFGEMTTFNALKQMLIEKGDKKSLLALLMSKADDILNTSVRQIGFSNFERRNTRHG